ncbi:MAG: hypothetical protein WC087_02740 [Candidatus Paceibacterota bacterium]
MNKILIGGVVAVIILIGGFFAFNSYIYKEKQADTPKHYTDVTYMIEGESVKLNEEFKYFGSDLITDLNDDGRNDFVFLITHQPGGSGTFYYAVAVLDTKNGYVGSDGYLLGDRIAPQTIDISPNPRHKNVIVVNYVDRGPEEPMTTQPSFGKSAYLKLDVPNMQWGIVEPNFAGESRS